MDATKNRTRGNVTLRRCAPWLAVAILVTVLTPTAVRADEASEREYQLKAAFLYNFIMFIDSPRFALDDAEAEASGTKKPILIGIIGKDPFGEAFEPLKDKTVRDRRVAVKRFKGLQLPVDTDGPEAQVFPDLEAVRQCHVLFVCGSERVHLRKVLKPIAEHNVLTVSDVPGFLEAGGMIAFVIEENKVRFEINVAAAERAKLEVRSKLLRLAKRIVKTDPAEG